jgi:hypothetical protein
MSTFSAIVIGRMQVNLLHQRSTKLSMLAVHIPSTSTIIEHDRLTLIYILISNQNELVSVPTHSILLPGQNLSNHMQASMLSAWQIVSLDYSEWIDSVAYADLDGSIEHEQQQSSNAVRYV